MSMTKDSLERMANVRIKIKIIHFKMITILKDKSILVAGL